MRATNAEIDKLPMKKLLLLHVGCKLHQFAANYLPHNLKYVIAAALFFAHCSFRLCTLTDVFLGRPSVRWKDGNAHSLPRKKSDCENYESQWMSFSTT